MPTSPAAALPGHEHEHDNDHAQNPALLHHFATESQQKNAASLGMWLFLAQEVMFFGGMFCAYLIYRYKYFGDFGSASQTLNIWYGTINTAVLICSSLTVVLGRSRGATRQAESAGHMASAHHRSGHRLPRHQRRRVLREIRESPRARPIVRLYRNRTRPSRSSREPASCRNLFLALLCDDRHARPAHDRRCRSVQHAGVLRVARKVFRPSTTRPLKTPVCTGTSSILSGSIFSRCSI